MRTLRMKANSTKAGRKPVRYGPAGFTLTEVIMASALLITAIAPILKALTTAHYSSALIERKTTSLLLAQEKLEDIKVRSIYNYATGYSVSNESLTGAYLCTVSDTVVSANLRRIAVSVGYDTNGNSTIADGEVLVLLETLLARRW